jgi:hypothetical protein
LACDDKQEGEDGRPRRHEHGGFVCLAISGAYLASADERLVPASSLS